MKFETNFEKSKNTIGAMSQPLGVTPRDKDFDFDDPYLTTH